MSRLSRLNVVPDPNAGQGMEILSEKAEPSDLSEIEELCDTLASIVYRILTEEEAKASPLAS